MASWRERVSVVGRSVWTGRLAVGLLAGLFLTAGILKMRHGEDFFNAVSNYHLLPTNLAYHAALWIPRVEILVALLVLLPVRPVRRLGLLAYALILVVFTGGLLSLWARGLDVNCGCFGGHGKSHPAWSVLRNAGLFLALALAWRSTRRRPEPAAE